MTVDCLKEEGIKRIIQTLDISIKDSKEMIESKVRKYGLDELVKVASGATKICLIFPGEDFVVKWSREDFFGDYDEEAMKECEIYRDSVKEGIDFLFPYTAYIDTINDVDIVIQEKVDFSCNNCSKESYVKYKKICRTVSEKILNKMIEGLSISSMYDRCIDELWLEMIISLYGKRVSKKLCKFVQKHQINDLHRDNIDYKNNHPVFLDFSGYQR